MDDPRFPGAPPGSYLSEEGWLVIDQTGEAWSAAEWATTTERPFRVYKVSAERRRWARIWMRQKRAAARRQ